MTFLNCPSSTFAFRFTMTLKGQSYTLTFTAYYQILSLVEVTPKNFGA